MLLQQMLTGIVFISWRLFCLVSSKRCNIIQFSEKKKTPVLEKWEEGTLGGRRFVARGMHVERCIKMWSQ